MEDGKAKDVYLEAIEALKRELRAEKIKSNIAILGTIFSVFLSIAVVKTDQRTILQSQISETLSNNQNQYLQGITTTSIKLVDEHGKQVANIDGFGINFTDGHALLSFSSPSGGYRTSVGQGFVVFDSENDAPLVSLTSSDLRFAGQGKLSASYGLSGVIIDDNTYTISLSAYFHNLNIFNDHFDQAHSDGQAIDQTGATFGPNNVALSDAQGVTRASIGQTDLTNQNTGATETTALSSIVLFDKSGHVAWQTP